MSFFVCLFAIKEEQKLVIEKNCLEKLGIIKKGYIGCSFLVLLVKENSKTCTQYYRFQVLNDKLVNKQ